ncbi:MAG: hypothetical protein WBM24_19200, partial [Candidatus Sulfotelmatobacter sp.]
MMPRVQAINALEPEMRKLSDEQLRAKTDEFRQRIGEGMSRFENSQAAGVNSEAEADVDIDQAKRLEKEQYDGLQEVLDEILVEAFAVVREAGRRVLNMRHFDVQL